VYYFTLTSSGEYPYFVKAYITVMCTLDHLNVHGEIYRALFGTVSWYCIKLYLTIAKILIRERSSYR